MLDKIIKFSIKNKVVIGIMTLLLIIWGIWSATKLPIDAVPDITNNQVQIITVCPTLAGQEVEQLVTFPIEQSIANIPNLEEVRSISRFGLSVITVVFKDEVNIYFARQLLNEKLKQAEESIPNGIGKPELAPVSTGLGDIYQLGHVFRAAEIGRRHNPEFTLAEWYRIGFSYEEMIEETCDFIALFLGKQECKKISYREAFLHYIDIDPFTTTQQQSR